MEIRLTSSILKAELDRLDAMHKFFLVLRKYRLYSAHINLDNIKNLRVCSIRRCALPDYILTLRSKVLDLGCGTGMWGLDMAKSVMVTLDALGRESLLIFCL